MNRIALQLLFGDKTKFLGLVFGIAFTSFMITFALSYLAGFLTRGFALIDENPGVDIWVMDPAVTSVEMTTTIPLPMLYRVKSVQGVAYATPMALEDIDIRFLDGRFQQAQLIAVDDATLAGVPRSDTSRTLLYTPDAFIADAGGTEGKLVVTATKGRFGPSPHVKNGPLRPVKAGDDLLIENRLAHIMGISHTIPRFPPRILLYTRYATAMKFFPKLSHRVTFILVKVARGEEAEKVARAIEAATGLRARTSMQFKIDTVRWYLNNSEDVGDMVSMLLLAMIVGFGVTGILLYLFTYENIRAFAILKAIGASGEQLISIVFLQSFASALISVGIGIGLCALTGKVLFLAALDYPFRMMWFAPLVGIVGVFFISFVVAFISLYPVLKMDPSVVFSRR